MMEDLVPEPSSANYVPLSPVTFLERASLIYGERTSIVYGDAVRFTWRQTHQRCLNLASSLVHTLGISRSDTVVSFAPNVPAHYELHFAVPMAGAILAALNTNSDATLLTLLLEQLEAKIIFVDYEFIEVVLEALNLLSQRSSKLPLVVVISDCTLSSTNGLPQGNLDYDELLAKGQAAFETIKPDNECDPISVNYTSGSTGVPKGAVYSHRAAYLNSLAAISRFDLNNKPTPVFLWTVDMYRCNGWCFTWAMAAIGGTNVCLRSISAKVIFNSIHRHNVTHFCGKPALLHIIAESPPSAKRPLPFGVNVTVAGLLPPANVTDKVKELGFNVNLGYGMTEVLGPAIVTPLGKHSKLDHPEGLLNLTMESIDVKNPSTMKSVPCDGKTMGEIMLKGNTIMLGYLKIPKATREALKGGWYRTGDIGIRQPDGSIVMKDRAKDMIMSKGEAVSSLEIEAVLLSHPSVLEAAVVGRRCQDCLVEESAYYESPCAFVKLKEGWVCDTNISGEDIVRYCGERLPSHMVPKWAVFGDLPMNSTGKVQKGLLREKVNGNDKWSNLNTMRC